jgi:hypothetical protein
VQRIAYAVGNIADELERLGQIGDPTGRSRISVIRNLIGTGLLDDDRATAVLAVPLAPRELQVLGLVAQRLSKPVAAERLVVSPEWVKAYMRGIRRPCARRMEELPCGRERTHSTADAGGTADRQLPSFEGFHYPR